MFNVDLYEKNLSELEGIMNSSGYDALIIPHEDEFLGEYIAESSQRLAFITGFTGSAGSFVIYRTRPDSFAMTLFVDGRYTIQARQQVDQSIAIENLTSSIEPVNYLLKHLKAGNTVAIDPNLHSYQFYQQAKELLEKAHINLVCCRNNPVDQIWRNKTEEEKLPIIIFPEQFIGMSSQKKRELISLKLTDAGLDAMYLANCESVNWLLNIRGHDIPYLPIVRCTALIYTNQSMDVFIDCEKLKASQFAEQCGSDVSIFSFSKLDETLKRLGKDNLKVGIDSSSTNTYIALSLLKNKATVVELPDPCELPKAIKTSTEANGFRSAHVKDGVAMCRFLAWLDRKCQEENSGEDEGTIALQAEKYRRDQEYFIDLSFATISALGPNAAMCHYNHENQESPRKLGQDAMYLIDSGAHYFDGTTDITRTICVGQPTQEMKDNFTRVLKGNIALAKAVFPAETHGYQLDILARKPLWDVGLDFRHGTGHGVGHCLSVHEGPQRISCRAGSNESVLLPNMIVTDEPGYYKDGEYGIRCENELLVTRAPKIPGMLSFEVLTLVPFDLRLINPEILDDDEISWLNDYHKRVRDTVKPYLSDQEISWLIGATKALDLHKNKTAV